MHVILPKKIEIQDDEYTVEDIDGNVFSFGVLKNAKAGSYPQGRESITAYIVATDNEGRMFQVAPTEKVLSCSFCLKNDAVYILKREKRVEIDFSSDKDYLSAVEKCFAENEGHGVLLQVDGDTYEMLDNKAIPDISGALDLSVTPFLIVEMRFFGITDAYHEGLVILDISSGTPVVTSAYSPTLLEDGVSDKKGVVDEVVLTSKGFERFCSETHFE